MNENIEYEIERQTMHGYYVALVTIDDDSRKQIIELYKGKPYVTEFLGLLGFQRLPIAERVIGRHGDVQNTITKMIIDWELPLYQKAKAEESGHFLDIDYEAELKKRRPRKDEDAPSVKASQEIPYHDYESGETIYILGDKQLIKPFKPKKNMTAAQLRNLPQNRNLTDEEIMRKYKK